MTQSHLKLGSDVQISLAEDDDDRILQEDDDGSLFSPGHGKSVFWKLDPMKAFAMRWWHEIFSIYEVSGTFMSGY